MIEVKRKKCQQVFPVPLPIVPPVARDKWRLNLEEKRAGDGWERKK